MKTQKLDAEKHSCTFLMLYYWGKILGINSLSLPLKKVFEFSYFTLFYGCFLGVSYTYIFFITLIERLNLVIPDEKPLITIIDNAALGLVFLENSITWFVFAFCQKRFYDLVNYFIKAKEMSSNLGIPDDTDKLLREFGINITVHTIIYVISLSCSRIAINDWPTSNNINWVCFILPGVASFNMNIMFLHSVVVIKRKYRRLNEKMQVLVINNDCEVYGSRMERCLGLTENSKWNTFILSDRIAMVSQLHRQLRDAISGIEELFAPLLFFSIVNRMVCLTFVSYRVYTFLRAQTGASKMEALRSLYSECHWTIYPLAMLILYSNVCGSASDEANNTGNILHVLINDSKNLRDSQESANLNVLSLDLLRNEVNISVFGFISLDFSFFYKMVPTIFMHLMIMLQFDN